MNACTNPDILRVIWFFLIIIDIVKIIVPIGLIILGIIDFSKATIVSDDKVQKTSLKLFVKRIIYAILIFAVPWIIEVLMITLGNLISEEINFTDCLENANAKCIDELEKGATKEFCDYGKEKDTDEDKDEDKDNKCWQCNGQSNIYYWGISPSTSSCPSGWHEITRTKENCVDNGKEKACYYCPVTNTYLWRAGTPSENCPGGIGWSKNANILTEEDCVDYGKACYYCPVTNTYLWRPGTPSENCPGGINWSKTDKNKEDCQ